MSSSHTPWDDEYMKIYLDQKMQKMQQDQYGQQWATTASGSAGSGILLTGQGGSGGAILGHYSNGMMNPVSLLPTVDALESWDKDGNKWIKKLGDFTVVVESLGFGGEVCLYITDKEGAMMGEKVWFELKLK